MEWGNKFWCRLSLFWRFQLAGWTAFVVLILPVKLILSGTLLGAVGSFVLRDGFSFLLTLAMRAIYDRIYRDHKQPGWIIGSVAVVSLAAALLQLPVFYLVGDIFPFEEKTLFSQSAALGIFYYRTGLFTCWSLLYFGVRQMQDGMERDFRLARAESAQRVAEIQLLRAQMNPHFLYNAFNTVLADVEKFSVQHLKKLLQALAEYLRYSLENRNQDFVPLGQELDAIENYLTVEKARFRGELEIEYRIDESTRAEKVPGIVLQPLVENAIKYGRMTSSKPFKVRLVTSHPISDVVRIAVSNTGRWIKRDGPQAVGGVGLANLRQRLELLYPGAHGFRITKDTGWVTVQVDIPAKP